jgi:hypothetical protein
MKTWTPAKPLSWFGFLLGVALGMALFAPLAFLGLAYTRIPVFLTGMTGIAMSFFAAALMALKLAAGIADGRYRDIHPAPWRQQVW